MLIWIFFRVKENHHQLKDKHSFVNISKQILKSLLPSITSELIYQGCQEILTLAAISEHNIVFSIMDDCINEIDTKVMSLPLLVHQDLQLPYPPFFCPQPDLGIYKNISHNQQLWAHFMFYKNIFIIIFFKNIIKIF